MDSSKHYPYNIPFYTDIKFIDVKFVNNEDHIINFMDSKDDKFEEARFERTMKQNFASSISNKLKSELIIINDL